MRRTFFRGPGLPVFVIAFWLVQYIFTSIPATSAAAGAGALTGLITNADTGRRLAGVMVSAAGQTVQSNTNGVYTFANLPEGEHLVTAHHPGFESNARLGRVVAGTTRWNSIALKPAGDTLPPPTPTPVAQTGSLIGLITDAGSGERLAGVAVSVAGQTQVTDGRGVYRFEAAPAGLQNVRAEREGYAPAQKTREVIAGEVRWNSIKLTKNFSGCPTLSSASFSLIPVIPPPGLERPDYLHGDLNLAQRGYTPTAAPLNLIDYDGGFDPNAPQLAGLFEPDRFPGVSAAYRVNDWDWGCGEHGCPGDPITTWPVTLLGLPATPGQPVYIPERGPEIYGGGFRAVVLYAEEKRLTLGYTRDDSVAFGYAVHIEDVCVDPNLLSLYRAQNNAFGFRASGFLPALQNNQKLGVAFGSELKVAIRDRGAFMDPRSGKDWWR